MTAPHDRTADQFDAWLETASQRTARPSSPNGATDPAAHDLVTTAHAFHASIRAAEQQVAPAIPAKAIWEDVMSTTTAGTITIPALAASGAGSPPNAPTRPTADSAWPKPGHWAVPTFLVVAAMIGILWFYSSFFGSTDPGPTPTSQPGFAFSTPTEEAIASDLLDPVTRTDCDVAPLSLEEIGAYQVDPGESVPREYGPIAPVSHAETAALYEASRISIACEAFGDSGQKQAVLSPRHIHEGRHDSIARNSASVEEYIANNQALAALLLDPNRTDYTAVSSEDNPIYDQATPATIDSWFGYRLLPQDVVQFPDGRMGGPLTNILPANYDEYRQGFYSDTNQPTPIPYQFTLVEYAIYAQHDDQWLLDETFVLCAANCDQWLPQAELTYQAAQSLVHTPTPIVLPGTPAASPVASQATPDPALQPITPSECTVDGLSQDQVSAIIRSAPESPSRNWEPVGPVDPGTADQINQADRAWQACDAFGSIGQRTVLQTDYLTSTGPEPLFPDHAPSVDAFLLGLQRFDERRALGDGIHASMDAYLATAQAVVDTYGTGEMLPFDQRISFPVTDAAILLEDDRVALPVVDPYLLYSWEAGLERGRYQFVYMPVHILAPDTDSNVWLVDEVIYVCVGDCDAARDLIMQLGETYGIDLSATPDPTTRFGIDDSLLDPGECTVAPLSIEEISAIQQSPGNYPDRQYGPISRVDLAVGEDIAELNREFLACAGEGNWRSMASQRLIHETRGTGSYLQTSFASAAQAQGMTAEEYIAWHQDISSTVLPGNLSAYVIFTDRDTATITGRVVQPHQVVQLADGRIGAPETTVLPTGEDIGGMPFLAVTFNIYVQEPDANDRWVLDESLMLCVGACGVLYEVMSSDLASLPSTTPPAAPAASPAATPLYTPIATPADTRTIRFDQPR